MWDIRLQKRLRLAYLGALYVVIALLGVWASISFVLRAELPGLDRNTLLLGAGFAWLLTEVCICDSRLRGRPIVYSFYYLLFVFSWYAWPVYMIWSRGSMGLVWSLAHLFAGATVYFLFYIATMMLLIALCGVELF